MPLTRGCANEPGVGQIPHPKKTTFVGVFGCRTRGFFKRENVIGGKGSKRWGSHVKVKEKRQCRIDKNTGRGGKGREKPK